MCGIVGVANYSHVAIGGAEKALFQNLLVADAARGVDGTGAFKIHADGSVNWAKNAGDPFNLFRSDNFFHGFWDSINREWIRWLVGHNRYATRGAKDTKSAHPFEYEHITMVHNGTVREKLSDLPELKEYAVDSEALCVGIARHGLEDTLKQIDGAYALAYYDFKAQTMNLIRNSERPLFVHVDKKDKVVSFASEKAMLFWAINRHREFDAKWDHITLLPENELLTWSLKKDEFSPKARKLEVSRKYKPVYYNDKATNVRPILDTRALKDSCGLPERGSKTTVVPFKKKHQQPLASAIIALPSLAVEKIAANTENDYFPLPQWGGLAKGSDVSVDLTDFDEVQDGVFMMKGENKGHPFLEFRCRVVGMSKVMELMSAAYVSGTVVTILVPSDVGRKKGLTDSICYISQPLAMYNVDSVVLPNEETIPPEAYHEASADE